MEESEFSEIALQVEIKRGEEERYELITEEYIRRLADEQIEQYFANLRDDSLIYPPLNQYK